jgi:hypothetical protein
MMSGKADTIDANTLLEAVRQSLTSAGRYNPGDAVAPAAVLWTDADGQWRPLVAQLRPLMPELLTLGEYAPEERTGPAIWLRCVIEQMLPEVVIPDTAIPVIYMPNVSRQTLRAAEECPDSLKPLVELQYRGAVWTQRNGKDWTVEAFLVSGDGGLGLDLSRDKQTKRAMLGALTHLAVTPLAGLRGKRLEAEDFDKLMVADTPRDLLLWLNDPAHTREEWDDAKWAAFCSRCKAEYGFDPESDGAIVAGEKLGMRDPAWQTVWQRYAESPAIYPGIPNLLRRAKPQQIIFDKEPWPDENETEEINLRNSLLQFESLGPADARRKIEELEKRHGVRRDWVWARLGQSPLAEALKHLAILARKTEQGLGGDSVDAMAGLYTGGGYLADDAVLRAVASVRSLEDSEAVRTAIRSIYLPWLENAARHFQGLISNTPLPDCFSTVQSLVAAGSGECLLFTDGLRFDIAQRLAAMAEERQLRVIQDRRWAGLPTVTATTKPAVSPLAGELSGRLPGEDFRPETAKNKLPLTADRFRKMLTEAGYQVFDASETGVPNETDARGWTEFGQFDKLGHTLQAKLATQIDEQLSLLLERIQALLSAGWKRVRVVTDHGWLLVPGGLPSIELPKYLTEIRWTRCAAVKPGSHIDFPTAGWHWNKYEHFAFAPGVHCFRKGNEYAHGGVSLQECLIPDLTFSLSTASAQVVVSITEVKWVGMRCRVAVDEGGGGVFVDLRTKPNDPNSSITAPKQIDAAGRVSFVVEDDSLEGTVASLVLLDSSGRVIGKRTTTVGGEE